MRLVITGRNWLSKNRRKPLKLQALQVISTVSFLSSGFIPDIFVPQPESRSSETNPIRKRGAAEWVSGVLYK